MKHLSLLLLFFTGYCCTAQTRQLNIATYNLRYDNADDIKKGNGWQRRCPEIVNLIRFNDFDLFGTQEGLSHQLKQLTDSLHIYQFIGVGRDDGIDKGEHSAIFYKTARLALLDKGNFWMSTITDKPNKGWDAVLPRICTWGKFKVKENGFTFYCFNLHMDHVGVVARRESTKLVLAEIRKRAGNTPVILTGDFNVDQREEPYAVLKASGIMHDAFEEAPIKWVPTATFNSFETQRNSDARIDHIFLNKAFRALRYGILNNSYLSHDGDTVTQRLPSDHYPVMVVVGY